jgi:hypothetical protein
VSTKFQNPPIQGQTFLDPEQPQGQQEPSFAWRQWFNLVATALSTALYGVTAPARVNSPGTPGQVATDGTYLYICVATNSWRRVAVAAF